MLNSFLNLVWCVVCVGVGVGVGVGVSERERIFDLPISKSTLRLKLFSLITEGLRSARKVIFLLVTLPGSFNIYSSFVFVFYATLTFLELWKHIGNYSISILYTMSCSTHCKALCPSGPQGLHASDYRPLLPPWGPT